MQRVTWSVFLCFVSACYVQSQCNPSMPGCRKYGTNCPVISTQPLPTAVPSASAQTLSPSPSYANPSLGLNRSRREALLGKNPGAITWTNRFDINNWIGVTEDYESTLLANAERLKKILDSVEFDFFNYPGLRITFLDDSETVTVLGFTILKHQWKSASTYFTASFKRVAGGWSFFAPALKITPGDEIEYYIPVLLGEEQFDFSVEGSLKIHVESPIVNGSSTELAHFCATQPPVPGHQTQTSKDVVPQPVKGRATIGRGSKDFRWNHQFTINPNYDEGFTNISVNEWLEDTLRFKKQLEDDFDLHFGSTTDLTVSIADVAARHCDAKSQYTKILAFNIKLNEEFKSLDPGQYDANVTKTKYGWDYHYPRMTLKGGDKIFYWMRVVLGEALWDNTVTGTLEIIPVLPHFFPTINTAYLLDCALYNEALPQRKQQAHVDCTS